MKKVLIVAICVLCPCLAYAESIYVTDVLKLKLRENADKDSTILTTLSSGDQLTLIEKQNNFTKVKTSDGLEGWVQTWFLVDKPTASYQLKQLKSKNQELLKQIEELSINNQENGEDDKNETALDQQIILDENKELKSSQDVLKKKIKQLTAEINTLNEHAAKSSNGGNKLIENNKNLFMIIGGIVLAAFFIGIYAAQSWIKSQERRRLRGYKLAK